MTALSDWLDRNSLWIALAAAWVATAGSLYFSEVAGFVPCILCWYQRIFMYPLTLILAIGLLRRDRNLSVFALAFSLPGLGIASYHYLLEKTRLFDSAATCSAGVPCTTAWINWFGFITIPFLSLVGFLIITLMAVIAWHAGEPNDDETMVTPWRPVLGIVAVIVLAFGLLAQFNRQPAHAAEVFPVLQTSVDAAQTKVESRADAQLLADGQRLYQTACASCHGASGEGVSGLGNALAGSAFIHTQDDNALLQFIRTGRAADDPANQIGIAMPSNGGSPNLTDADLTAIIGYLRHQH